MPVAVPHVPPGYHASLLASGLRQPTAMAFAPDGVLYVAEQLGRVVSLGPGERTPKVFATGFRDSTLGLTWFRNELYVVDKGRVSALRDRTGDRVADARRTVVDGLPNKLHQQDSIVAGRDGRLYLGNGTTCNACVEKDRRSGTILSFLPNGKGLRVVAGGLRNPYGLAFDAKGQLWATDNGRDDHDDEVPEELDRIRPGARYGWPACWGAGGGTACAGTVPPVATMEPHGSADGLAFAPAGFAPGTQGNAFVALWGTYFGQRHGRYVVRITLGPGKARVTRFATGFAHPLAVAFTPQHALLVADHGNGRIWRITYRSDSAQG